jgi:hypothetical protein
VESPPGRRRNSLRLPEYDYAQQGLYYVTTVALVHGTLFGTIDKGRMDANSVGRLVTESLLEVPKRFPNARIESYVLMPNHIHILLQVHGDECPIPVTQAAIEGTHDCRLVGAGASPPTARVRTDCRLLRVPLDQEGQRNMGDGRISSMATRLSRASGEG